MFLVIVLLFLVHAIILMTLPPSGGDLNPIIIKPHINISLVNSSNFCYNTSTA